MTLRYMWFPQRLFYDEFMEEFTKKNGADSYIAISVKDYENLSKNFSELRRYIDQQKKIILSSLYRRVYDAMVKPSEEKTDGADD